MGDITDGGDKITLAKLQETVRIEGQHTRDAISNLTRIYEEQAREARLRSERLAKLETTVCDHEREITELRGRDRLNNFVSTILAVFAAGIGRL